RRGGSDGADAPAREHLGAHERLRHAARALGRGDAAEEALTGIRRPYAAWPLVAVEREGVGRQVVAPELVLEGGAQLFGFVPETVARRSAPERIGDARRANLGIVDVRLHLGERDGRVGERAV